MKTRPRPVKYRRKNKLRFEHIPGPSGVVLEPYQVIMRPLVTEKGTHQSSKHNGYSFKVNKLATKSDIKSAIEVMFNVRVTKVCTQIRHGKARRVRFKVGHMPDWKKAIVFLHEEDKIDFF
ncbi:MAG: 50S ribosomal protein L23 [Zavarzinella sp.]